MHGGGKRNQALHEAGGSAQVGIGEQEEPICRGPAPRVSKLLSQSPPGHISCSGRFYLRPICSQSSWHKKPPRDMWATHSNSFLQSGPPKGCWDVSPQCIPLPPMQHEQCTSTNSPGQTCFPTSFAGCTTQANLSLMTLACRRERPSTLH
ncbi:hypothetical protein DR999_PMT04442 [Platysternon megacephalum]|uniref:Uncharacterized protein n=1 Tax=Platysternon megacephalum TaxID=55544 RepID=A0A4D9ENV1_9SAUR|nr:hypothetical protein DR999_PMT04442 [Platysternon megacephalum]